MNRKSAVWIIMTCGSFLGYIFGWMCGVSGVIESSGSIGHLAAAAVATLMGIVGCGVFETLGDD